MEIRAADRGGEDWVGYMERGVVVQTGGGGQGRPWREGSNQHLQPGGGSSETWTQASPGDPGQRHQPAGPVPVEHKDGPGQRGTGPPKFPRNSHLW